ncbi:MAG: T9SS type A sorting domain-containing protein [Saprospiraceae bacterium]|nr:T9SS type A sorting domain-containing protein [Saprospiraceae bacterium]
MTRYLCILIFLVTSPFSTGAQMTKSNSVCDPIQDSLELVQFYQAMDGDNWLENANWLIPGQPVDTWYGVTTDFNGCVEGLILTDNQLSGEFYDIDLPNLQFLLLSGNAITGSLPDFTLTPELIELRLSNTLLSGSIPNFSGVPKIHTIFISDAQLDGPIPDFSMTPDLYSLFLGGNELTGTIPDFTSVPKLVFLNLINNQISGAIPDFQNLSVLKYLTLSNNELSGEIPDFSTISNLVSLDLSNNNLTGPIPDFSNFPNLTSLILDQNDLGGVIPDFSNLSQLVTLKVSTCNLVGNIPNFSNLESLKAFFANNNQLSGTIPDFSNIPALLQIELNNNNLSGEIPDFSNLPELTNLTLRDNQLTGEIPDFSSIANLRFLSVINNQLTGSIPDFSNIPKLFYLGLQNNHLSGTIPDFSNLPELTRPYLSYNQLTGEIPDFSNIPKITELNLDNNNLTGEIPDFSNIPEVGRMILSYNQFTGPVPPFSNCPNIYDLFLNFNQLSGEIPDFSNLSKVNSLALYDNQLTGEIPDFSNLPKLYRLWLWNNQLSGPIPNFSQLPELGILNIANNSLTGSLPDFSQCGKLAYIVVGKNELTGQLPAYSDLQSLIYISAENNHLSGGIPTYPKNMSLWILNNHYTFTNIIESGNLDIANFQYTPQRLFYADTVIYVPKVQPTEIHLGIDPDLTSSSYHWQKDSLDWLPPAGNDTLNNFLIFPDPQASDAGRYTASVVNSEVPFLELHSMTISLRVCDVQADSLELVNLYNATNGPFWSNPTNWLTPGKLIGEWAGITTDSFGCVRKIDLSSQQLTGDLPALVLNTLDTLILHSNALVNTIPELNTPFILMVDLHNNQFSGDFPQAMSTWMNLEHLDLSTNGISSAIPPDLGDLCELTTLRLNNNNIPGELPEALTMLIKLKKGQVDFSDNDIDSLKTKIIWFCPYGDTILQINPSYDRFLGICNVQCAGNEWDDIDNFPWIADTINNLKCDEEACMANTAEFGFVLVRGVLAAYTKERCFTSLTPTAVYTEEVQFLDCAGHVLEETNCDQNNFCSQFGALTEAELKSLKFNPVWQCGQAIEISTAVEEPETSDPVPNSSTFTFNCSPNPTRQMVTCTDLPNMENAQVQVLNIMGQRMPNSTVIGQNEFQIDLGDLTPGIYFIIIQNATHSYLARVILQP